MPLISEKDAEFLKKEFEENLVDPVKLVVFTQDFECQFCAESRQIVEEIAELSETISAEVYDFVADKAMAELYSVDKIPAIAVIGAGSWGTALALQLGLHYVYVGNVAGHPGNHTYCHRCKKLLIERQGYFIPTFNLAGGRCKFCNTLIPGVWHAS